MKFIPRGAWILNYSDMRPWVSELVSLSSASTRRVAGIIKYIHEQITYMTVKLEMEMSSGEYRRSKEEGTPMPKREVVAGNVPEDEEELVVNDHPVRLVFV